jgi:hypothetical protein
MEKLTDYNPWSDVTDNVWEKVLIDPRSDAKYIVDINICSHDRDNVLLNVFDNVSENVWQNVGEFINDNVWENVVSDSFTMKQLDGAYEKVL